VPRFRNNPSRTVRGGAPYDHDTTDVLLEHGYTAEQIQALYDEGTLKHGAK
jgi:crotonobetainyl-CoA:carnitine CoA-transferase CaiB-like acyl-CoA transferase